VWDPCCTASTGFYRQYFEDVHSYYYNYMYKQKKTIYFKKIRVEVGPYTQCLKKYAL